MSTLDWIVFVPVAVLDAFVVGVFLWHFWNHGLYG